ncbi:MAG: hypothetical protein K5776_05480 [Lachnospiraceae bacterium]|nr:hypothetical protein [Lachnospiraceae bacterium]
MIYELENTDKVKELFACREEMIESCYPNAKKYTGYAIKKDTESDEEKPYKSRIRCCDP